MQGRNTFQSLCVMCLIALAGCGKQESEKPVVIVVNQTAPNNSRPAPGGANGEQAVDKIQNLVAPTKILTAQERYEAGIAHAFQLMSEKKEDDALLAFQEAQAAQDTDFLKTEIERLKVRQARIATAQHLLHNIKTVLSSGRPDEASRLASDALGQFGASEAAEQFTSLKRQADALLAAQLQQQAGRQRFLDDAEAARKDMNYRAAVLSFDQAIANGAEPAALKPIYDKLRDRLNRYDELTNRASELRRDSDKLDEALATLEEARKAWETPQILQEIDDLRIALNNRRDRLAIADFEVIGDIGIPLAGRTIAEELLPHFKGRFDLAERSQLGSILLELKLDAAELQVNERGRSEVGKLAKARFLVVGSISQLYGVTVNARLVDVQTGLVVQTAKIIAASPQELQAKLPELARILQMSDEEKMAREQELARAANIEPAPPSALPPPPPPPTPDVDVNPIVVFTPRPPIFGDVVIEDFEQLPPPVAQPRAIVIARSAPWSDRAFFVAVELGDNLFRRGQFREAMRHFDFALSLRPGREEIRLRIDRCRPFLPPPAVFVVAAPRPRLAVLPFVEIGQFGFVPPGMGAWTADCLAPYFFPAYDIVERGEVSWWMGRLGLSFRDVLIDSSARLCLARAMGVRFFLMGNLRETARFDATAYLIDAEFDSLVGSGRIHVRTPYELKLRLNDLARLTFLPPQQREVFVQQTVVVERRIEEARIHIGKGKWSLAIDVYREVLETRPDCIEARAALLEAERRQRQVEFEEARRIAFEREQARIRTEQERQLILAAEAERQAALRVEVDLPLLARQQQQAQVQLLFQARNALKSRNFSVSINLFESASSLNRSPELVQELAQARAQAAEIERARIIQDQRAREAALMEQNAQQAAQARAALLSDQQRRAQEEQERRRAEEIQTKTVYERLLDQAEQAKGKGQYDAAVSALQTARTLRPSPEIDRLVASALVDQAKAEADKRGVEERRKLETQLLAEQERRRQAEVEAAQNKAKYDTAIAQARAAMAAKKFDEAKQQFQIASLSLRTDESIAGLRQAQDEAAKIQAAALAARTSQEQQRMKEAEAARLINEAKAASAGKQYDKALQHLQAAINLKPGSVEAHVEIVKARQAREEIQTQSRIQKDQQDKQANFQQLLDAGKANIDGKQYDAAIVTLTNALKIRPTDVNALAALKMAQQGQAAAVLDVQAQSEAKKKRDQYEKLMQHGQTALGLKNYDAAIVAFNSAQTVLPGDVNSSRLLKESQNLKAEAVASNEAKLKTSAIVQALARARGSIKANKFDDAASAIASAAQIDPNYFDLKKVQQELADARNAYGAAQKLRTDDIRKQQIENALEKVRQSIAVKQFDAADKALEEVKRLSPGDPSVPRLQQAIADGRTAIVRSAEAAKVQAAYDAAMTRGKALMQAKQFAQAADSYTLALKYIPNDSAATHALNDARSAMTPPKKDPPKVDPALAVYNQNMAAARNALGLKRYDEAIRSATEALRLAPNDPEATKILNEARTAITPAKKDPPKFDSTLPKKEPPKKDTPKTEPAQSQINQFLQAAVTAETQSKYAEAMKDYQEALKLIPNHAELKKKVDFCKNMADGQKDLAAGRFNEALLVFELSLKLYPADANAKKYMQLAKDKKKQ